MFIGGDAKTPSTSFRSTNFSDSRLSNAKELVLVVVVVVTMDTHELNELNRNTKPAMKSRPLE